MRSLKSTRSIAGAAALLLAASAVAREPGATVARSPRVVLVAIDGLDWEVMTPLLLQRRMPQLARCIEAGASGQLESLQMPYALRTSATLVTGVTVQEHGVYSFDPREMAQRRRPRSASAQDEVPLRLVTSDMRRTAALWELTEEGGLIAAVVGWNNTWPVDGLAGWMIGSPAPWATTPGSPGSAYPEELAQRRVEWLALPRRGPLEKYVSESFPGQAPAKVAPLLLQLDQAWKRDREVAAEAICLLEEAWPDLFLVQLPGLGSVSEAFWKYTFPRDQEFDVTDAEAQTHGNVLPEYYVFVDEMLGELMSRLDLDETTIVIVSGQGYEGGMAPRRPDQSAKPKSPGVLVIAGRGARPGAGYLRASIFDVAPTVLSLLGLATPGQMRGRVVTEAFLSDTAGSQVEAALHDAP